MEVSANVVQEMKEELGDDIFDKLLDLFKKGQVSVAEVMQIPHEELDNLHQYARLAIVRKDYDKAERVLAMLTSVDPYTADYWLTYGIVLQVKENWEMARFAFTTALNHNSKIIEAYVRAAECDIHMKTPSYALEILKAAFLIPAKSSQDIELLNRAKKLQLVAEHMEPGEFDRPDIDAAMAAEDDN